jgi:hypothetical protein
MKLDPGMHIGMHLVFFGKSGVTQMYPANLHKTTYRPRKSKLEMRIQRAKENVGCIKRRKNELEGTFAGIA